jgi:hypothetical protein
MYMKTVDRKVVGIVLAAAMAASVMSGGAIAAAPAPAKPVTPPPPAAVQQPKLDLGPMVRPTDDPAKVAAAKQFIMLYHPQTDPKNINKVIDVYMPRAIAAAQKKDPKLDVKKFDHDERQHFLDNGAKSLNNQSHVVSRHFTLQELKDMSAFFSSPLGRKLTTESPKITQEMRMAHRLEMMPKPGEKDDDDDDDDAKSASKTPAKPPAPKYK